MIDSIFTGLSRAIEGGPTVALSAAFAWGILSIVLSPCHLASIPLIVGFIDEQGKISTKRAFQIALLFALGILICQKSEERLGISDHSGIVWDEIVGYLVTMTAVPFSWPAAALGFALFRLFDILKPWPIRHFDRTVHGGFGIMLDDVLAGVLAAACLQLARPWLI